MEYIDILTEINYLSYIGAFVKWITIFFILSVLILILITKLGLLKRQKKVARILVKLYYVVVPFYFVIFAVKFAPVRNSQVQLHKVVENHKVEVAGFAYGFLDKIVADSIKLEDLSVKQIVDNYLEKITYADSVQDKDKSGFGKQLIYKFKKRIEYSFLSRILESKIIRESTEVIGIKKTTGKAIYKTNFRELFKEGELVGILQKEINDLFNKLYMSMLVVFLIGLIIPVIEIALSRYYKY